MLLRRRDDFHERFTRFRDELKSEILSGHLQPDEFILPENALSEKYGMSRASVRKVLAELVEAGLIEKIPGKGNRVVQPEGAIQRTLLKLSWFVPSYEIETVQSIIKRFENSQPYIKIELLLLPEREYTDNIIRMIEQGEGPDVIMLSDMIVREFASKGKSHLLAPFHLTERDTERSYPELFELFHVEGQLVALPFIFSPVVICYNERLFREASLTGEEPMNSWDALVEIAKRLTSDSGTTGVTDQFGFCFSASPNRWPLFALQNGSRIITEEGRWSLSDPAAVEAVQFCVDLMYKHKVSPIYSHGSNHLAESLFVKERVAMILTTYYFMNEFRGNSIEWNVRPVASHHNNASTLLLGGGLAVNAKTVNSKAALSFIDYMVNKEAQTMIKQNGCTIPMLRSVAEDDQLLNPAIHPSNYNIFKEMLPHCRTLISLGIRQNELLKVMEELHLLWANMEKPDEACLRIDELMNTNSSIIN